jgi:putative membrane-bound dehydrogenase-like protein
MRCAAGLLTAILFLHAQAFAADQPPKPLIDPFWPTLGSPNLLTPDWTGDKDTHAVVVLAIDDMRLEGVAKYETFMRPIIDRLKRTQGRAPISIMTCTADPMEPQLQAWIKEGLNLDLHTTKHPCPLLGEKGFEFARDTVQECYNVLATIPGNRPVAYRMPCCDSLSSPSPRFYADIFPKVKSMPAAELMIDTSVMNLITPADKSLPREVLYDAKGNDRFAKYFPGIKSDVPHKQKSLRNFGTYIENYPYPYLIGDKCWELPCVVPSDWEAYNVLDKANPQMLEDWQAALDAIVMKRGVFTLVFHPHGWCTSEQVVALIDYAETRYAKNVKFMNFAEVADRLSKVKGPRQPALKKPSAPLPDLAKSGGAHFVDLNADGHEDLVVSNSEGYGVYLYNPVEKKNVQWEVGWTQVMREGKPGDANSIPMLVRADGTNNGVWFKHGAMWVQNEDTFRLPDKVRRIPYEELRRVPGPAPKSPQESLADLKVKDGYAAALVAHEPQVQDPIFIDWDARGRMWVVEMGDYPFAAGETTKDGKVGQGKVSDLQTGRIKILEDENGDGFYEKATLFLDGLTHPTGLAFWKNGVFISSIPNIFFAEDTDGDGRCDRQEVWFSGFTAGNPQHLVNGFCWGLDGWLYGANGDSGGDIRCVKTGKKVALGTNDFRFDPRTGDFRLEAGRSQYGKWRDDFGNWFGNNNSIWGWHYWLPLAYLERHPEIPAKSLRETLNADKQVFPISPPMRRFNWANATNTLTSGCSPMPYRDTLLGEDGENVLFICEPSNNLVHREVLDYSGTSITSRRHPDDEGSEFIASRDNWFRPSMARTGPDGALYVVDMYRLVLEHPEWIPADIANNMDVRAGEDRGRIYAVRPSSEKAQPVYKLADRTDEQLVSALNSRNGWIRDTAQRLLIERNATAMAEKVAAMAKGGRHIAPAGLIQAAYTAQLLGGLKAEETAALLKQHHPKVRGAALAATGSSGEWLTDPELALLRQQTTKGPSKAVAQVPVITNSSPDREKVVARYNAEVATVKADPARGAAAFQKACMACHKAHGQGVEVGPDLGTVATKPREQLIEAIFDPNRAVELRNAATQVTRKDGAIVLGLLAAETPGNVTLRLPGGVEQVVMRADIKEMKTLQISLMPPGLEAVLSPQEVADLLAWIQVKAP